MSNLIQAFLTLCKVTLPAAGLILCLILVRGLMIRWAPRRAIMLLWLAVALRLILPFSFETSMSLFPSEPQIPTVEDVLKIPADDNMILDPDTFPTDGTLTPIPPVTVTPPEREPRISIQTLVTGGAVLWVSGMALLMLYAAVSYVILTRRVAEGVPYTPSGGPQNALPRSVKVKRCEGVRSPFILGIFSPCIYLPYGLDETTEACVLAHEAAHIRRGDHIIKLAAFALVAIHWFNPLVWVAWVLYCRDIEVACDERAVKDMSLDARKTYAAALVSFLPAAGTRRWRMPLCPPAFGETGVGSRIKKILANKKPVLWTVIPLVLVAVILTAVFFMISPRKKPDRGQWEGVILVQGSTCDFDGVYLDLHTYDPDRDGRPYLEITFENRSGEAIGFGEPYEIYYLEGDTWVDTAVYDVVFHMPLYLLDSGKTTEKAYTPSHCDLTRYGTYKFVTEITYPTNKYGATEDCEISLTFVLAGTDDVIGTYPEDFAIHFEGQTGGHPDCLDTFEGYLQKDLVEKEPGYAKTNLTLSPAQKQYLWEITKQCDVLGMGGDRTGSEIQPDGTEVVVNPNRVYTLTIRANGETNTVKGDREAQYSGKDARLYVYIHLLQQFMYGTEEWGNLPRHEGGYE